MTQRLITTYGGEKMPKSITIVKGTSQVCRLQIAQPILLRLFKMGTRGKRLSRRAATLPVLRGRSHELGVRRKYRTG